MNENEQIDGRSTRAQGIYKLTHDLLLESAIELLNNPKMDPEKVTLAQIAKNCKLSTAVAYKHFPDRMMDVYGGIITKVSDGLLEDLQIAALKEKDPIRLLERMLTIYAEAAIETGHATRIAFSNRHTLLREEKWIEQQPVDTMTEILSGVPKLQEKPRVVAQRMHYMWNGLLFLWISYQKDHHIYSKYTDSWFRKESKNIVALALQS